jgi:AcrR family transcriptional regulator
MPEAGTRGNRRRPSRERIAEVALRLLEREGLEALTMRRLSADAGIPTATLYGYFRDKDELVDALIDVAASASPLPEVGGPWRSQVGQLMRWLREQLARHPDLVKIRLERPILSPQALRLTERGMDILLGAGFARGEAALAYQTLFVFTFASAAFLPRGDPDENERRIRAAYTLLPPEEYPALTASLAEAAAALDGEKQFDYGLERLLDGLEASLHPRRRRAR